jgi:hypothetical protein
VNTHNSQTVLHDILLANGVFCFTSGLIFALATSPLSGFLNTTQPVMTILGIAIMLYGVLVGFNATRPAISRRFTFFSIISDSIWVLASILLLILPIFRFTSDAKWAIGIIAICMDIFATFQFLEWRKM